MDCSAMALKKNKIKIKKILDIEEKFLLIRALSTIL
jgi:hypothetical protein